MPKYRGDDATRAMAIELFEHCAQQLRYRASLLKKDGESEKPWINVPEELAAGLLLKEILLDWDCECFSTYDELPLIASMLEQLPKRFIRNRKKVEDTPSPSDRLRPEETAEPTNKPKPKLVPLRVAIGGAGTKNGAEAEAS